jgi:predicted PolB exonuclease-like 3'-5' exonuclease
LSKGAIKRAVDAQDKGLFIKYDGDIDDDVAIKNWFNSTKRGDVILNLDSMGRPLLTDSSGASLGQFVVSDGQGGALFE